MFPWPCILIQKNVQRQVPSHCTRNVSDDDLKQKHEVCKDNLAASTWACRTGFPRLIKPKLRRALRLAVMIQPSTVRLLTKSQPASVFQNGRLHIL